MAHLGDLPQPRAAQAERLAHLAGAVISASLVLGLAVWGYKLAVRDVNGVPVVRAMEGPMRIAPNDPGGTVTAHQGLAVNNVAAEGSAAAPADTLVLAPAPIELAAEDMAGTAAPLAAPVSGRSEGAPGLIVEPETGSGIEGEAVELAVAEALAAGAVELSGDLEAGGIVAAPAELVPVTASIRPRARPATAEAAAVVPVAAVAREVDPATLVPGTRLAQLGAFDTAEAARAEWDRLSLRFGELLADKGRVVMAAQSGGRAFFRLRAEGFADEADARRFCAALLAEQASCVPVAQR